MLHFFDEVHHLRMPLGDKVVSWLLMNYVRFEAWFTTRCPEATECELHEIVNGNIHDSASEVPLSELETLHFVVVPLPQPVAPPPPVEDTVPSPLQPEAALQDGSLSSTCPLVACFPKSPLAPFSLPLSPVLPSHLETSRGRKHSPEICLPSDSVCKNPPACFAFPYTCGFPQPSNLPRDAPRT